MGSFRRGDGSTQYTPEELFATMKERLGLSNVQEEKVRPIIEEYCKKQQDIIEKYKRQEHRGGECCLRCDLQRLGESTEKQLAAFLTEKQLKEYQKIQEELQPKPSEGGQQRMGKGGVVEGVGEVVREDRHRKCNSIKTTSGFIPSYERSFK